jgi:hypothetical protein
MAGWTAPTLPTNAFGRGLSPNDGVRVERAISEFGALGAPGGLGLLLAAPTIATHGTAQQVERFVGPIVTGRQAWCQLFSEPAAGSDLAGLQTRAVRDTALSVGTTGGRSLVLGRLQPLRCNGGLRVAELCVSRLSGLPQSCRSRAPPIAGTQHHARDPCTRLAGHATCASDRADRRQGSGDDTAGAVLLPEVLPGRDVASERRLRRYEPPRQS